IYILQVRDDDGTTAKIGIISATLPFNKAAYVGYTDALQTAQTLYKQLKDSVDAVVALTHQLIADDIKLAQAVPELAIIMGGHEHNQRYEVIGRTPITKAHANARSAYVIELNINKKKKENNAATNLVYLNDAVALDSATNTVVQKWMTIAEKNYDSLGFDAKNIVLQSGDSLEGRETEVRSKPTNLTQMIIAAMHYAAPQADVAIMNAGSIRVDDILSMPVTQYDFIRSLPFGGGIREVDMKGNLLINVLNQGWKNRGIGGFLHYSETLPFENNVWKLSGLAIDAAKIYRVAITDFLLTGGEANLDFLNPKNPDIVKIYPPATTNTDARFDIRLAIIRYLKNKS
ncbi:MAG: 5'-nucleotidase C-terminal domain-containing protein, partial [Bacteroidota bacterium]